MDVRSAVPGLPLRLAQNLGDPAICIAVLDGPVDQAHPCLAGADLTRLGTLVQDPAGIGPMSLHGTHVTSLLFGQPGSPVVGIAPRCRGLLLPVFRDGSDTRVSQLDLARAIERAVQEGAHVVNISGGERTPGGVPDPILARALQLCEDNGVLVVAAVGNDGCDCLQVPAAVSSVVAVGATDGSGEPLAANNWGEEYQNNGVLAPGQHIVGAAPGGGEQALTGSSFATPVVSGVAALLLASQLADGHAPDPLAVRDAIVGGATECDPVVAPDCRKYLAGKLNGARAYALITRGRDIAVTTSDSPTMQAQDVQPAAQQAVPAAPEAQPAGVQAACEGAPPAEVPVEPAVGAQASAVPAAAAPARPAPGVSPAASCECGGESAKSLVYVIGTIGFDFRTEARRDSFRQQMDPFAVSAPGGEQPETYTTVAANPYDPNQLSAYLARNPWASDKLTWTLNMDRTPLYALEAELPVGMDWGEPVVDPTWDSDRLEQAAGRPADLAEMLTNLSAFPPVSHVYKMFRDAIAGQARPVDEGGFISRVSVPGVLTNRTVRLFSGQVVPVVEVKSRGIHTWNEAALVEASVEQVTADVAKTTEDELDEDILRQNVRAFLDKVYYQFRNLGQTPADRALNYAGTNAFMFTNEIRAGLMSGRYVPGRNVGLYTLDTITVAKSPYDRVDSDCWDVVATFFDPENERRARVSYLFTIDVSDELPVSLAPAHRFLGT
ncbi:MAG: S8 family serine peptidase [Streptosporangiales bacterium]|nr:S8 family serine peptidase [Streptosporangiales bacterium]